MASLDAPVSSLSGGNAQKVVIGKWLLREPSLLLLNDPTKGVDVGSKGEFYALLDDLRRQGTAILFYSSDDEELLGLCGPGAGLARRARHRESRGGESDALEPGRRQYGRGSGRVSWRRFLRNNPYLFALLLLAVLVAINAGLQANFFSLRALNGNFRVLLPLMILAAGQAVVIIGGGIDLSVGTTVSLVNAVLVTQITPESGALSIALAVALGCAVGMVAGALNGFCVAVLRLQPIVTTYATSFIFSGAALLVLPRPGGQLPRSLVGFYRSTP